MWSIWIQIGVSENRKTLIMTYLTSCIIYISYSNGKWILVQNGILTSSWNTFSFIWYDNILIILFVNLYNSFS